MTVTVYRSTDPSAPVLSGEVGSLITVLDACLVNGYGAKASAGWTKAFSATNKASYKQPAGSNGFYLDVDDSLINVPRFRAYETMTAIATGTNPTPSDAQVSGGLYGYKSNANDATSRPWLLITNGKIFYIFNDCHLSNYGSGQMLAFGDIVSFKAADAYHTILIAAGITGYTSTHHAGFNASIAQASSGHYLMRSHTQIGNSIPAGKFSDPILAGQTIGNGTLAYPNPVDGGLHIAPVRCNESTASVLRGVLPGIWAPLHSKPLVVGDTFSGTGELAGKTFEAIGLYSTNQAFLETSNTW